MSGEGDAARGSPPAAGDDGLPPAYAHNNEDSTHTYAQVAHSRSLSGSILITDLLVIRLIRKSWPQGGQDFKSYIQARVAAPPP